MTDAEKLALLEIEKIYVNDIIMRQEELKSILKMILRWGEGEC